MTRIKSVAALLALAYAVLPVIGEAADDVAALRAELQALKTDYAARVAALEVRIMQLESGASTSPAPFTAAAPTATPAPAQVSPATRSSAAAFNPAISLILAGNYTNVSEDPEGWQMAGFMPSGGEVGPGERSFNLGESELAIIANVDPYF